MQRKTSKHNDHCDHNDLVYWQLLHFWPTQWSLWDKTHTMILVWVLWSQDGSCDHILSSQVITASLGILSSQVIASCDHKMGIVITMILVWVLWLCLDVSWHLVVSWSVMTACVIMTHQHVSSWHINMCHHDTSRLLALVTFLVWIFTMIIVWGKHDMWSWWKSKSESETSEVSWERERHHDHPHLVYWQ